MLIWLLFCCRCAIPINRFHKKPEQEIEEWYELRKNDFAADSGCVSHHESPCHALAVAYIHAFCQINGPFQTHACSLTRVGRRMQLPGMFTCATTCCAYGEHGDVLLAC